MALPQRGLAFLREVAEATDQRDKRPEPLDVDQGNRILSKTGRTGARVCKFVMSPGPNAQLVVLAEQPGERHPLVGTIHDVDAYEQYQRAVSPHRHWFEKEGRPLESQDAVAALAYLSELAAANQCQPNFGIELPSASATNTAEDLPQ